MTTSTTPPAHLARVYELLIATYGKPEWVADYDPLGGLVGTILSQNTSDSNSERAYQQLMATFPSWEGCHQLLIGPLRIAIGGVLGKDGADETSKRVIIGYPL